jgi:hypothetical protein
MTEAMISQRLEQEYDRVRDHSAQHVNRRIVRDMNASVEQCVRQGRDAIMKRLAELDHEWDIDRVLMANFAVVGGAAYGVGMKRYSEPQLLGLGRRRTGWLYFFGAQLGFLLMHATVGWCPPLVVWRRLGVRTKHEIELERSLLRGALGLGLRAGELVSGNSVKPPAGAS